MTAKGATGHASRFIEPTAMEQIVNISRKALEFRKDQKDLLHGEGAHAGCSHAVAGKRLAARKTMGDVTSLNITTMKAGVDAGNGVMCKNIIPPVATATFDIRISPHMPPNFMRALLDGWCQECAADGGELGWDFYSASNNMEEHYTTPTDAAVNPWYERFAAGVALSGVAVVPGVFPAATDSRFLRVLGIRALGFSPMRRSEILLHEYNEYLDVEVFEEGVEVYTKLIRHLCDAGEDFGV